MARTTTWASFLLVGLALTVSVAAQEPAAQTPTSEGPTAPTAQSPRIQNPYEVKDHAAPDMVCFGYGPKWSIQFVNGEARYLGVNQPDQYFLGDFYKVADENAWEWHRADDLAPMNGNFGLSASIQKESCTDPVRRETFPYTGQINLPQGDMVSGCCRKLKPGEAPVGRHGLQQTATAPSASGTAGSATGQTNAQSAKAQSANQGNAKSSTPAGLPKAVPQ